MFVLCISPLPFISYDSADLIGPHINNTYRFTDEITLPALLAFVMLDNACSSTTEAPQ